jgi:hypothetical protein
VAENSVVSRKEVTKLNSRDDIETISGMPSNSLSKIYPFLFLMAIVVISNPMPPLYAACGETAFYPGEKLTFKLKWGVIPAGEARLEVLPIEIIDGREAYHFVMTARTNAFIDAFYKYRSRIDAYADVGMNSSIRYHKKVEARGKIKEVDVYFDWEKSEARYLSIKKSHAAAPVAGGVMKPVSVPRVGKAIITLQPGSFDPLSVFYYTRLVALDKISQLQRPVSDGKKCVLGTAEIKGFRKISMPSGTYSTYLIEPDLEHLEGVFKQRKNATIQIWITTDERRLPVKLKSKIVIGSFTGELVSATDCPSTLK